MNTITLTNKRDRIRKVQSLINSAGNKLFAVSFIKKDGTLRKMVARKHVVQPSYEKKPTGDSKIAYKRDSDLITVFDTNLMRYNKKDRINGRGGYRSINLSTVKRLKVNGVIYKIVG